MTDKKKKVKYNTETIKITYKGETRNVPKRYVPDSLKGKDRTAQIKSIFEGKNRPKTAVKERTLEVVKIYPKTKDVKLKKENDLVNSFFQLKKSMKKHFF